MRLKTQTQAFDRFGIGGRILIRTLAIPMFIFLLLCGARNTCAEQGGLQFGLINTMKAEAEYDIWHPLIQDLSAGIGIPITAKVYDDYAGVVWAMEAGKVQIASMGNASAIEAVDRAGAEIALRKVDIDGTDG